MKILLILLLAVVLMGCGASASNTNVNGTPTPNQAILEYRDGMEDGVILSTVVVGEVICTSMKANESECKGLQGRMAELAVISIKDLSDTEIKGFIATDPSYRSALKSGSISFSITVGNVLCKTVSAQGSDCQKLKLAMAATAYDYIDKLTEEQLNKLKNAKTKNDLLV
jgi:hypothetical protein